MSVMTSERDVKNRIVELNRKTIYGATYNMYRFYVGDEDVGCDLFSDCSIRDAASHVAKLAKENPGKPVSLAKTYRFPDGTYPAGQLTAIATVTYEENGSWSRWRLRDGF